MSETKLDNIVKRFGKCQDQNTRHFVFFVCNFKMRQTNQTQPERESNGTNIFNTFL